jgi:outer membrane murein-binding lipoprotein Lpp
MQEYQQLKALVLQVEEDLAKAVGGNRAAGTRVRKAMQEIKNQAQEIRKRILEVRSSDNP